MLEKEDVGGVVMFDKRNTENRIVCVWDDYIVVAITGERYLRLLEK